MKELIILLNSITSTYSADYVEKNWFNIDEIELLMLYIKKINDIDAKIDKIFAYRITPKN